MPSSLKKSPDAKLEIIHEAIRRISEIVLGKTFQIKLSLACLLAQGHLLIEDLPGMGKTTLIHALAKTVGLDYKRVQFTSDLLPADLLGASIFDRHRNRFRFLPGPVFTQLLMADEINRATPKTQSALLEAMGEHQVSIEGGTYRLPNPFFVVATQNPAQHVGVYPLPESQLDRFLMQLSLGYPDPQSERRILSGKSRASLLAKQTPILSPALIFDVQKTTSALHISAALLDYIQAILKFSRQSGLYRYGLSPRAGLAILASAKAWAFLAGRDHVLPEDIQIILPAVINHRLIPKPETGIHHNEIAGKLLRNVAIP